MTKLIRKTHGEEYQTLIKLHKNIMHGKHHFYLGHATGKDLFYLFWHKDRRYGQEVIICKLD